MPPKLNSVCHDDCDANVIAAFFPTLSWRQYQELGHQMFPWIVPPPDDDPYGPAEPTASNENVTNETMEPEPEETASYDGGAKPWHEDDGDDWWYPDESRDDGWYRDECRDDWWYPDEKRYHGWYPDECRDDVQYQDEKRDEDWCKWKSKPLETPKVTSDEKQDEDCYFFQSKPLDTPKVAGDEKRDDDWGKCKPQDTPNVASDEKRDEDWGKWKPQDTPRPKAKKRPQPPREDPPKSLKMAPWRTGTYGPLPPGRVVRWCSRICCRRFRKCTYAIYALGKPLTCGLASGEKNW